ncbi:helix-turn-helix domain-containing protein [Pseudoduganella plicata]|uniref:AraC family transcriptional regulator n=1 Tax=Pseudoduganella plicata TaxID=321984 RepID=A0A4P7BHZ1_9BURK|nr:AraC family transcriptional regulator [Pseudoduganella plicata]QBQ37727.1 AraC family transcriptional regulator [Pseudoduganella plicata]GGY92659.1 AraC family transcriptional regulator [Pseudoduganella plicata]
MNDFAAIDVLCRPSAGEPAERSFQFGPHLALALATCSGRPSGILVPAQQEPLLLWIASGSAVATIGAADGARRSMVLRQGDILLNPAPQPVQLSALSDDGGPPLKTLRMHIGLPMLSCAVQQIHRKPLTGFVLRDAAGRPDDTVNNLLDLLHTVLKRPARPCVYFLEGVAQALVAHLVRRYAGSGPEPAVLQGLPPHKLARSLRAMREALDEPFNLKHLATQAGLSIYHFSRCFKLATGLSPSRYFMQLRIEEAKRLLCETAEPVVNVALALGYRSPSHFAQVFREQTGVSPSVYRTGAAVRSYWTTMHGVRGFNPSDGAVR